MKAKIRDQILRRQRRNAKRLKQAGGNGRVSVLDAGTVNYEISSRIVATSAGGVRLAHDLARAVQLPKAIDERLDLLKIHRPYHESDHVLSLAYNLLAGGTCIEDLEQRRSDDAFLDMLGVERIPDPTTAGDFCRVKDRLIGATPVRPIGATSRSRFRVGTEPAADLARKRNRVWQESRSVRPNGATTHSAAAGMTGLR